MTSRVLVTARCPAKGHVLAELLATPSGVQVRVRHLAVGQAVAGKVHNRRGGHTEEPLDRSMSYIAVCGCGHGHPVSGAALAHAADAGETVVIARAILWHADNARLNVGEPAASAWATAQSRKGLVVMPSILLLLIVALLKLTPEQRTLRASIAAHTRWSKEDPAANAARGQAGLLARFEREARAADPGLPDAEVARRAQSAYQAHMGRLSFASSKARAARKAGGDRAAT